MNSIYNQCLSESQEMLASLEEIDYNNPTLLKVKKIIKGEINKNNLDRLYRTACSIRDMHYGKNVYVRASIEISNICTYTCKFCGMSINNKQIKRYILTEEEVFKIIDMIAESEITQIHLVSGESSAEKIDYLCNIIRYAKEKGLYITLVLGRRPIKEYLALKESGADRYILKFETSNSLLYSNIKGGSLLYERIADLLFLRKIGFKIGTGIIYGLPGSNINDTIRDLELLAKISPDMASISVFSPNENSFFKNENPGNKDEALRVLALIRLKLKNNVPMISCSSSFGKIGQKQMLKVGANVISYHATPSNVIDLYSAYKDKNRIKTTMANIKNLASECNMNIMKYR